MFDLRNASIAGAVNEGVVIIDLVGCAWKNISKDLPLGIFSLDCTSQGERYCVTNGCGVYKYAKKFNSPPVVTGVLNSPNLNFGIMNIGDTSCKDVTIKNTGIIPFTLQSFTVVDPIPFSVTGDLQNKLPVVLKPN